MTAAWKTIRVTSHHGREVETVYAVCSDQRYYEAEAILIQSDETGTTRTVLGFLFGFSIVPAEELPGWLGRIVRSSTLSIEGRAEALRDEL
ncbi:hypothetical protein [Williamsia sp. 1135]|uniref:hypothetical protein n=1 Tax=Williamsia sp. 1135 TaxID=1889262 RepID=UPI000A100439|nr:hypothetical protein [Williamsia sp. 1135]ORM37954.1 hypothetical protein BFL43_02145 [Williamsia sp. 1135]